MAVFEPRPHRPAVPSPGADRLRCALEGGTRATNAEVRAAVFAYVATLKSDGLPPERVLVAVKAAARSAGIPDSPWLDIGDGPRRMSPVVGWCIEEYYRAA